MKSASLLTVVALCLALGLAQGKDAVYGDAVLAIVGDTVITTYDLHLASRQEEIHALQQVPASEYDKAILQVRDKVLSQLIDRELVFLEFQSLKAQLPPAAVQERLDKIILARAGGDRAKFEELLHESNMTMDEFKEKLFKDVCVDALLHEKTQRGIQFSQPQLREYYDKHPDVFQTEPQYRLEVILLRKAKHTDEEIKQLFQQIRGELEEGAPFPELAKKYSEGANASGGGDQGWKASMNERLLKAIKGLKPGEICPEELDLGNSVYLVRLAEVMPGGKIPFTQETAEKIRTVLTAREESERYDKFIRELRMKYSVRRFD